MHEQSKKETFQSNECPACSRGVTGQRQCMQCSKPVHHFDECSKAFEDDEEGYSQRRVCNGCYLKNEYKRSSKSTEVDANQINICSKRRNKRNKTRSKVDIADKGMKKN